MDGQVSGANYAYTAFKWETAEETDADEQIIVCEVQLAGSEGMAYNPDNVPQRNC